MLEIEFLATGEIKHQDQYVGRVEWTAPMADLDGVGVWVREQEPELEPASDREMAIEKALAALKGDEPPAERVQRAIQILED